MTDISLPWTYVYRYPDGALRMSGGREINGSKPVEAIGVYLAPTFEAAEARVRELEAENKKIVATFSEAADIIRRQQEWQAYGRRLEREADVAMADEIQDQRRKNALLLDRVRELEAERDEAYERAAKKAASYDDGLLVYDSQGHTVLSRHGNKISVAIRQLAQVKHEAE